MSVGGTVNNFAFPLLPPAVLEHFKRTLQDGSCFMDPDICFFMKGLGDETLRFELSHNLPQT